MIKYLLFLMLVAPAAEAQSGNNQAAARKIDRIVRQVQDDSSLHRVPEGTSVSNPPGLILPRQRQAVSYFKDSSLVRYHVGRFDGPYLSGFSRDYYFRAGKLIYLHEEISNSSRMGSYGTVTVKYDYYLRDDEIIFFRRGQPQNFYETCYGNMGPKNMKLIREALEADKKSDER